ncbi:MAG: hypothetical protein IKW82_04065 [Bacteroidales bacterium]|nr:hypothetical protein [Bacteroidales bacterium]
MKNLISILCILALNIFITGCQEPKFNEKAVTVTFLVDVTDKPITTSIVDDFNANLNAFFSNTGLGKIDLGQSLTVRMGPIDESDQLSLQTRSIALTDKNVSRREAERHRNPRPILEMIKEELARYEVLSETQKASPIIDVTLKAFKEMSETNEILVICTDGLETVYANFYRNIPNTEQAVEKLISKVDPVLLSAAMQQISASDPQVVIVLKPNEKVKNTADLKLFYSEFMRQLGVTTPVTFIDNLSNKITIYHD